MLKRLLRISMCLAVLVLTIGTALPARAAAAALVVPPHTILNTVTGITFNPTSPNVLSFNQNVTVHGTYTATNPAGVLITALPYTGSVPTANAAESVSPTYPMGSGPMTSTFTITMGEAMVTQVRIQIRAADNKTILDDVIVPVSFQFTGAANLITNIRFTNLAQSNILAGGESVNFAFDFTAPIAGGIMVSAIPMTGVAQTTGSTAAPTGPYSGSGTSGIASFSVPGASADVVVDHIDFHITGTGLTADFSLPVHYVITSTGTLTFINDIVMTPAGPNVLGSGQQVKVDFHYTTNNPTNVQVVVIPNTAGAPSLGSTYSPVSLPTGPGTGSVTFMISTQNILVNSILVEVLNTDQTVVLYKKTLPVHYQFVTPIFPIFLPVISH